LISNPDVVFTAEKKEENILSGGRLWFGGTEQLEEKS
jgi:hypothetical protein